MLISQIRKTTISWCYNINFAKAANRKFQIGEKTSRLDQTLCAFNVNQYLFESKLSFITTYANSKKKHIVQFWQLVHKLHILENVAIYIQNISFFINKKWTGCYFSVVNHNQNLVNQKSLGQNSIGWHWSLHSSICHSVCYLNANRPRNVLFHPSPSESPILLSFHTYPIPTWLLL